jgi:hypothetical protein
MTEDAHNQMIAEASEREIGIRKRSSKSMR